MKKSPSTLKRFCTSIWWNCAQIKFVVFWAFLGGFENCHLFFDVFRNILGFNRCSLYTTMFDDKTGNKYKSDFILSFF